MHLSRDLLDNQVLDGRKRKIGKVDDVVIVLRRGKPPHIMAIELGFPTLLARISPALGSWAARLERRLAVTDGEAVRIPMNRIEHAGINLVADIDADRTAVYAWERWVRKVFIGRIPGHGAGGTDEQKK
jgi:sporulation protein YlmC with PRC-barrel domain